VVSHYNIGSALGNSRPDFLNRFRDSGHRAGNSRCITHQLTTSARNFNQTLCVEHTRFVQG
jgi:hypothetical protein